MWPDRVKVIYIFLPAVLVFKMQQGVCTEVKDNNKNLH